jgi:pyridoxine 5-phosphate synthase
VLFAAALCLDAGAHGITVHPRPDERHIRRRTCTTCPRCSQGLAQAEFNIEGNPFHNLMDFVRELRPHQATFVPDSEASHQRPRLDLPDDAERCGR